MLTILSSSILYKCACGSTGSVDKCNSDETTGVPICPDCGKVDPGYEGEYVEQD